MSEIGKLCSKVETGELCYSAKAQYTQGDRPLVYKINAADQDATGQDDVMTIAFTFSKLTWVCNTYHATHAGAIDVRTFWDGEQYNSQVGAFEIRVGSAYASGTQELLLSVAARDLCAAHEDPEITCAIMATMGGVTKIGGPFPCPLGVDGAAKRVAIFIRNGALVGVLAR